MAKAKTKTKASSVTTTPISITTPAGAVSQLGLILNAGVRFDLVATGDGKSYSFIINRARIGALTPEECRHLAVFFDNAARSKPL